MPAETGQTQPPSTMETEQRPEGFGPCKEYFKVLNSGTGHKDVTKTIEKLYDSWADSYEDDCAKIAYRGPIYAGQILQRLLPDKKDALVVDCGSGTGLVGKEYAAKGYTNIVGVDLSEECLKIASATNAYKKLVKCAVGKEPLPFEDNEADILITTGSMSPTLIQPDSLHDQFRVVKKGGYVVVIQRLVHPGGTPDMIKKYEESFTQIIKESTQSGIIELVEDTILPNYIDGKEATLHICKVL